MSFGVYPQSINQSTHFLFLFFFFPSSICTLSVDFANLINFPSYLQQNKKRGVIAAPKNEKMGRWLAQWWPEN
jgi:hypothetical protein